jgi:hypothetical protein
MFYNKEGDGLDRRAGGLLTYINDIGGGTTDRHDGAAPLLYHFPPFFPSFSSTLSLVILLSGREEAAAVITAALPWKERIVGSMAWLANHWFSYGNDSPSYFDFIARLVGGVASVQTEG